MRLPRFIERKNELLATAMMVVLAYLTVKMTFVLPRFGEVYASISKGGVDFIYNRMVLENSGLIRAGVVALAIFTLGTIWSRHRLAGLLAAVGIISLGVATQIIWSAALSPWFTVIDQMGK